jgi:UPF0716 family protein affecting phage T7 exclusion
LSLDMPTFNYLSGFIGLLLVRKGIVSNVKQAYSKLKGKQNISQEGLETLTLVFSGLLFLIPGIITDCMGAILVIPVFKKIFINYYLKNLIRKK